MKKIFSRSYSAGFTLIELLVVAAIISFMSILMLTNYRAGEDQFALQTSAYKLAQNLRRAEEMAMSAREFQGEVPAGGYGIYLWPNPQPPAPNDRKYILFGNRDTDNYVYNQGTDFEIEVMSVEKGVKISEVKVDGSTKQKVNISFIPPDPQVWITPAPPQRGLEAKIILILENDITKTKTITVNESGLIAIE